jgi:hypothetical protein
VRDLTDLGGGAEEHHQRGIREVSARGAELIVGSFCLITVTGISAIETLIV